MVWWCIHTLLHSIISEMLIIFQATLKHSFVIAGIYTYPEISLVLNGIWNCIRRSCVILSIVRAPVSIQHNLCVFILSVGSLTWQDFFFFCECVWVSCGGSNFLWMLLQLKVLVVAAASEWKSLPLHRYDIYICLCQCVDNLMLI